MDAGVLLQCCASAVYANLLCQCPQEQRQLAGGSWVTPLFLRRGSVLPSLPRSEEGQRTRQNQKCVKTQTPPNGCGMGIGCMDERRWHRLQVPLKMAERLRLETLCLRATFDGCPMPYGTFMGGTWEVHGRYMGGAWEVHGRCMGGAWEVRVPMNGAAGVSRGRWRLAVMRVVMGMMRGAQFGFSLDEKAPIFESGFGCFYEHAGC